MIAVVKGSSIHKEIENSAKEIMGAGIAAKQQADLSPLMNQKTSAAVEQTVHTFLKETRRSPCDIVLRDLKSIDTETIVKLKSSFRLLASTENVPAKGGIVPIMGMVMRSDLEQERQKYEEIERTRKPDYRPRNKAEFIAHFVGDGGDFFIKQAEAARLVHQIMLATAAPSGLIGPLTSGMRAGSSLIDVSGALPAVIVIEALTKQLRKILWGNVK